MALSRDRMIKRRDGVNFRDPVAADAVFYVGALVCLNAAGFAIPGDEATGLVARGICTEAVDNTDGSNGAVYVDSMKGIFNFKNSADGDEITRAHIGDVAWVVDDETVALTDASATRSAAGQIADLDSMGVWVEVGALALDVTINEA